MVCACIAADLIEIDCDRAPRTDGRLRTHKALMVSTDAVIQTGQPSIVMLAEAGSKP